MSLLGLRGRLLSAVAAAAVLAMAILVLAFNVLLDRGLQSDADRLLSERSAAALRTLSVVDGKLRVGETPDRAAADVETWVFDATGRALEQPSGGTSVTAAAALLRGGYRTVDGSRSRLYATPILDHGRGLGTLVVGASLAPFQRSARDALRASLLLGAALSLVLVALAWWAITRALQPVARMTEQATEWSERDLGRRFLDGPPHDELTRLAATFDGLLDRVTESLAREQRFTAEISHELRTPLARIRAQAELAPRPPAIDAIAASAVELEQTLDALLASAASPRDARTSAGAAARRAMLAGEELILPGEDPIVAVDPQLLERALAPLLENARRFATTAPALRVESAAGRVRFEVSDDGPGVPASLREQIFEPGFSAGGGGSGAGLGLPLARRLVESAGGQLTCVEGAVFVLELPAAGSSTRLSGAASRVEPPGAVGGDRMQAS
ncbi:MAG: ATP-binding protein [Solirubrobacteraceae bacterium]